jgi:hypothetical protein
MVSALSVFVGSWLPYEELPAAPTPVLSKNLWMSACFFGSTVLQYH